MIRLVFDFPFALRRIRRAIERFDPDIVHINEVTDLVAMIAARQARRPCVTHIRANFPRLQSKITLGAVDSVVDAAIVPSKSVLAWIEQFAPRLAARTEVIYEVAFDPVEFRRGDGARIRNELRLGSRKLVLLVSKLGIFKGHMVFLDAVPQIAAAAPDTTFAIVGDVLTDRFDEAQRIRDRADSLRNVADVRMLGLRRDLPDVMAAADVFVHCPIYGDPFPTVIPEAMITGRPVVGSRIGGIPEQIEHERTGLLVEPSDARSLAEAVIRLLLDHRFARELGERASRYAEATFVPERQRERQAAFYERILATSSRAARTSGASSGSHE